MSKIYKLKINEIGRRIRINDKLTSTPITLFFKEEEYEKYVNIMRAKCIQEYSLNEINEDDNDYKKYIEKLNIKKEKIIKKKGRSDISLSAKIGG